MKTFRVALPGIGDRLSEKKVIPIRKSTWLWIGSAAIILSLAAYPKPDLFLRTVRQAVKPPIEAGVAAEISRSLPDDPSEIEAWVIEEIERDAKDYAKWE